MIGSFILLEMYYTLTSQGDLLIHYLSFRPQCRNLLVTKDTLKIQEISAYVGITAI